MFTLLHSQAMTNGTAVEPASPGPPPPVPPPATVQQQAAPALMRAAPTSPLRSAPGLPPLAIPRCVCLACVSYRYPFVSCKCDGGKNAKLLLGEDKDLNGNAY
jgi:hypothetical protein